jgi:hypothetical protein
MADVEAYALHARRLKRAAVAGIKIDSANLERVRARRDGRFIVTRIPGRARFGPI